MASNDNSRELGDWEQAYRTGDTPWDTGQVDALLRQAVEGGHLPAGRLLEIGCGTGTNARYLAGRGYRVTAVDLSPLAIEKALLQGADGIAYQVLDVLAEPLPGEAYDAVFDRGCFHLFSDPEQQRAFVEKVAGALRPGGCWLSLIGSTEGDPRDHGPPRRTAANVVGIVEPYLEILSLRATRFADVGDGPTAWEAVFRRRRQPAQPATSS